MMRKLQIKHFVALIGISLSLLISMSGYAQTRQITGTVTSADGVVPGATVAVKGTTIGVMTDAQGAFRLSVPENATLVVSAIGYNTQEVAIGPGNSYNIKLSANVSALNEVVVVGYGTSNVKILQVL
jgi:hypothetical protein